MGTSGAKVLQKVTRKPNLTLMDENKRRAEDEYALRNNEPPPLPDALLQSPFLAQQAPQPEVQPVAPVPTAREIERSTYRANLLENDMTEMQRNAHMIIWDMQADARDRPIVPDIIMDQPLGAAFADFAPNANPRIPCPRLPDLPLR